MLITVVAAGFRGDVEPYLALSLGLREAGYQIRFATSPNFADWVSSFGVDVVPVGVDSQEFCQDPRAQAWLVCDNTFRLIWSSYRVVTPVLARLYDEARDACRGTDAIIYHNFSLPITHYIGQELDVPCLAASAYPVATRAHPTPAWLHRFPRGRRFNLLTHWINDTVTWQAIRSASTVGGDGAPRMDFHHPSRQHRREGRPVLCGYSPCVLPVPPDYPDNVHVTGYWPLPPPRDWSPPAGLLDFLRNGEPPVYVGFSSMGNPHTAAETTQLVVEALQRCGRRGILGAGWSGLGKGMPLPESFYALDSVPFDWLLPQTAAVVHHGGAGSTGAGLRSGVPSVVIPHYFDQFFWGNRLFALGAAPKPIPRRQLSAQNLAVAINEATGNAEIGQRSASIGVALRREDGVAKAVDVFERYLGTFPTGR